MNRQHTRHRRQKSQRDFEALESRQLLSAATWYINGTTADDVIAVAFNAQTQAFDLTLNGVAGESRPLHRLRTIVIRGGAGNDTITVNTGGKKIACKIYGEDGNDTIHGGASANTIYGGNGDDALYGGAGKDGIDGGAGNDYLDGGMGNDRLFGRVGNDTLIGGLGRDYMDGSSGQNTLYAATRRDSYRRHRPDSIIRSDEPLALATLVPPTDSGEASPPPAQISEELRQRFIDEAVARYKNLFGTTYTWYPYLIQPICVGGGQLTIMSANANGSAAVARILDHSTTNTQVQGVDEADLIETDGNFIYAIRNNQLVVFDVRKPAQAQITATMDLGDNSAAGLYLVNGRVVVLTQNWNYRDFVVFNGSFSYNPATSQSTVWVFDVADPTAPALVDKTVITGNLVDSRMVGDQLYLVMGSDLTMPPPRTTAITPATPTTPTADDYAIDSGTLSVSSMSIRWWGGDPVVYQYETEDEYRQWLNEHIDAYLPSYATTLADGTAGPAGSLLGDLAYAPEGVPIAALTSVVDFDVSGNAPGPATLATAVGYPTTVYATGENLYVFSNHAAAANVDASTPPSDVANYMRPATDVLKFNIGNHAVQFDAAGHVEGTPLNSYAMDEYNGQLRIVTEDFGSGTATHSLYVLSDTGDQLTVTGTLSGIGDGESLRAVRFAGDRAFVVTFRQVDPLFAIDLTDPANPQSLGELVTPGFSTYLYPIDADHLIGIGQGQGSDDWNFHNVQVSLFDVTDLTHPTVIDQDLYSDGSWVSSQALYDPHAFSYFAEQGVMTIPLASSDWSTNSGSNELLVLKVDPNGGFTELGRVDHDSTVLRSLRIGDNLYSLAEGDLKIVNLMKPGKIIADVVLPSDPVGYPPGSIFVTISPDPIDWVSTVRAM